jgi:hypothetical protein
MDDEPLVTIPVRLRDAMIVRLLQLPMGQVEPVVSVLRQAKPLKPLQEEDKNVDDSSEPPGPPV